MNLQSFLPFEKYTLVSELSEDVIKKRLAEKIEPEKIHIGFHRRATKPYEGGFNGNHFKINEIIYDRHGFKTIIKGIISSNENLTYIKIHLRPTLSTLVFMFLSLGLAAIICFAIVFAGILNFKHVIQNGFNPALLAPFAVFILGCMIFMRPFKKSCMVSRTFLSLLFEGKEKPIESLNYIFTVKIMKPLLLLLSTLTVGLMAGLFFAWSVSVMPGLKKLPDREFIMAMQSMNKAIQNPLFFTAFFGAAILLPVTCFVYYSKPFAMDQWLLLMATLTYLGGIMGVTIFGNVPLNNMLDNFNIDSPVESIKAMRVAFENKWNALNTIRSLSAIASLCLLITMMLARKYNPQ